MAVLKYWDAATGQYLPLITPGATGSATVIADEPPVDPAVGLLWVDSDGEVAPVDSDLTAIAALTTTAYGRAFLELANAAAGRTALGLGTAATSAVGDFQPIDSDLTAIAALSTTAYGRAFLALADASAARTALGLGTVATTPATDYVPVTLADAKGDLLTATADNTPARLAVGAEGDTLVVAGSAASGLAWVQPQPRNLLTVNQSSVETDTTGLAATTNCTIARTTAAGTFDGGAAALAVTSSAAGSVVAGTLTGTSGVPVVAGRLYSAVLTAKSAVITSNASARIRWWTSGGAAVSTTTGTASALTTSAFGLRFVAGLAPATAAYATVEVTWTAAGAGEVVYVDKLGLWEGYGGTWALGGQPIQGIGERWDETVGRRCFSWDWNNSREQMVYGDTGFRNISALLNAPADASSGGVLLRRVGFQVFLDLDVKWASAWTSGNPVLTLPAGFRPSGDHYANTGYSGSYPIIVLAGSGNVAMYTASTSASSRWHIYFTTSDAWPSTLPGTASGSIPAV